jgi:hypothetical protein
LGFSQGLSSDSGYLATSRVWFTNNLFRGTSYAQFNNPKQTCGTGAQQCTGASGFLLDSSGDRSTAGPVDVKIANNGLYGLPGNHSGTTYWGGTDQSTNYSIFPWFDFDHNAVVVDGSYYNGTAQQAFMEGDSQLTMTALISKGVFPNSTFASNILFNYKVSSGTTCASAQWGSPLNTTVGICPAGMASSPSTINATLGMTNYASCVGGASASDCALSSPPISGVGPDVTALLAAEQLGNDYYAQLGKGGH